VQILSLIDFIKHNGKTGSNVIKSVGCDRIWKEGAVSSQNKVMPLKPSPKEES
jgi:hypothetical protein